MTRHELFAVASQPLLLIGGGGLIGARLAQHHLEKGERVRILDNLSRPGAEENIHALSERHGRNLEVVRADVRDRGSVRRAIRDAAAVYHLASQSVAITSEADPLFDADVNIRGTLHVLEALRNDNPEAPLIFTSTYEVYGPMSELSLHRGRLRYQPADPHLRRRGIDERQPLDLSSAYGCSRGAADQYVIDYARHYDLRTSVLRLGCVYGPEVRRRVSHGYPADFLHAALAGSTLRIPGDGRQVRDLLHVDDLLECLDRARERIDTLAGRVFNVGGGPRNSVSMLELVDIIRRLHGRGPEVELSRWPDEAPRYFAADNTAITTTLGWQPQTEVWDGIEALYEDAAPPASLDEQAEPFRLSEPPPTVGSQGRVSSSA